MSVAAMLHDSVCWAPRSSSVALLMQPACINNGCNHVNISEAG